MFNATKDITLINVNTVNPARAVNVLNFSSKCIEFDKTILFSNVKPNNITDNITFVECDVNSIYDYNVFILKRLVDYIETKHCLIIQNDGFVINPHLWNEDFLNYDYIGAPWNKNGMRVWGRTNRIGNGGFSLRSKELLKHLQAQENIDFNQPEDVTVSNLIENSNFKYPKLDLAVTFSLEDYLEDYPHDLTTCFGFHGSLNYDNLVTLCPNVLNIKKL